MDPDVQIEGVHLQHLRLEFQTHTCDIWTSGYYVVLLLQVPNMPAWVALQVWSCMYAQ